MTDRQGSSIFAPRAAWFIAIVVLGLGLRLAGAEYTIRRGGETLPDSELYIAYAERIFHHQPYELNGNYALRTPGYPAFLAGVWALAGERNDRAVLWVQALLGALSGVIVFDIARLFEKQSRWRGWSLLAMVIAMVEPYGLVLGSLQLSETVFTFLFLLSIDAIVRSIQRPHFFSGTWGGIFAGAAILVRPSLLLLGPIAAFVALVTSGTFLTTGRYVLVMGITTACFLAPWWVRNYKLFHAPVLTTLNVGESLFDGLNPKATGASEMSFTRDESVLAMSEKDRDDHWRKEAINWARANPARLVELACIKFARFWSPWPNEPRFQTPMVMAATTLFTVPVYLLAIIGVWSAWRGTPSDRILVLLVLVPTLYFCGLHLIFVSSVRYRAVIMPLLALVAGLGVRSILPNGNQRLVEVS
ncbi:glycosyltransferase family 39 protein [bacterium]|nr:glycosyltransferase family 39 protein [bacterium]